MRRNKTERKVQFETGQCFVSQVDTAVLKLDKNWDDYPVNGSQLVKMKKYIPMSREIYREEAVGVKSYIFT